MDTLLLSAFVGKKPGKKQSADNLIYWTKYLFLTHFVNKPEAVNISAKHVHKPNLLHSASTYYFH